MMTIIEKIIDAHGGAAHWNAIEALEAEISVKGFLFRAKRIPILNHMRVRALTREPRFTFFDFPQLGQHGEFLGDKEVHIADRKGNVLERRVLPRTAFRKLRRLFYWDTLDFIYFGGYATWNYFVEPFVFLCDGFRFEEMEPINGFFGTWSRVRVTFPDDMPTHSRIQIFYFDEQFLLRRLDYTAEVVGGWAHAAHFCDEYRDFNGLKIPTRRRVIPMLFGSKLLPGPTLVEIEVHEMRPIRK